jgi:alpha-N-acetylglucosaminidase
MLLAMAQRQREFGMKNVLSAFAGHVPAGLKRVFPHANITLSPTWANFAGEYRVWLLDPFDPVFQKIGYCLPTHVCTHAVCDRPR